MKKILLAMLSLSLLFSCAVVVSAESAQYRNAGELYQAWNKKLPDYICGVWSTDGSADNLTFGIQDTEEGNAGKQEILALIENDASAAFVYQTYSRNYLLQIQKEIDRYMKLDLGLISTGLYDTRNCIELGILEERKDDVKTQALLQEIIDKYGNAVFITYTADAIFEVTLGKQPAPIAQYLPIITAFLVIAAAICFYIVNVRKRNALLQVENGVITTPAALPTVKEVERMVKQANCSVSSELDQKIMDAIGKD